MLLDRTHTLKVQQIQKEYQEFMERIRNKAQVRHPLCTDAWPQSSRLSHSASCCLLAAAVYSVQPVLISGWCFNVDMNHLVLLLRVEAG